MIKWFKDRKAKKQLQMQLQLQQEQERFAAALDGSGSAPPTTAPAPRPHLPNTVAIAITKLPPSVLQRIFTFVNPISQDETFEVLERSRVEGVPCALCVLRDLAHCARVCRAWRESAESVLYHSLRIDPVHFCPLEGIWADKRKRKTFDKNAVPEDVPTKRLVLLARTLRENPHLAIQVQFLKLHDQLREYHLPDLARCVAVLPNLRYVDLPEGLFKGDAECAALRHEIEGRCLELRHMRYRGGTERALDRLADGRVWQNLEVLELSILEIDPMIMRVALGLLTNLKALKISQTRIVNDRFFLHAADLPPFPPISELVLEETVNVTIQGIASYLTRPEARNALKTLSLTRTGVHPAHLHHVLNIAPNLAHLSIREAVATEFPVTQENELLASTSLKTLHYEITPSAKIKSYERTTDGYYAFLRSSILAHKLPNLRELYVRDEKFPESLTGTLLLTPKYDSAHSSLSAPSPLLSSPSLTPPSPAFTPLQNRFSSNNPYSSNTLASFTSNGKPGANPSGLGLRQELIVYSKGPIDEDEWMPTRVKDTTIKVRGVTKPLRPISSSGLIEQPEMGWAIARQSVVVESGAGGFVVVPEPETGM